MKRIDLCSSLSARGCLRAIALNAYCFNDDLSYGPIKDLDKDSGTTDRKQYIAEMLNNTETANDLSFSDLGLSFLLNLPYSDEIIIWTGKNVMDKILYYAACFFMSNDKLKKIDVSEKLNIQAVADGAPDNLKTISNDFCNISEEDYIKARNIWIKLVEENSNLRIFDKEIISVSDDYYDSILLEKIDYSWNNAGKIIGMVMKESFSSISDFYLLNRIFLLGKERKIEMKKGTQSYQKNIRRIKKTLFY